MDIVLEVGLNHFGKISFSKRYLNYFLKSDFKYITYQIQKDKFYEKNNFSCTGSDKNLGRNIRQMEKLTTTGAYSEIYN